MNRYLTEPRNILAEPLGSAETRLKNTALGGCERSKSSSHLGTFVPVGEDAIDVKGDAGTKRLGTPALNSTKLGPNTHSYVIVFQSNIVKLAFNLTLQFNLLS